MDFHNMKRKELQQLCKKHKLPANLSNFEMVDKLSSLFMVQEEQKEKPLRKTRSCLKNSDEMLSENESDVLKKNVKKVRFSPENDVFQLGERGSAVENKGGAGRVTRGRASLLCKTVLISPVVMKKKGKRAVQEVEKEDLAVENKGGASRVTRARASLGKNVVVSSPVVMKKRAKRAVQEVEKKDLDVESKGGVSRVTRAGALVGEKVLIPSPVVMKKRGKKVVQEDEKGGSVVENQGGATRVTRARAGNQVLIPSPVVMKKRGKKAVQEDETEDLVVENKGGASRVTRARAGKQVLISSPVVMKKRGKRAVQEEKKSGSAPLLVVDFTNPAAKEENEVITVKFLRNRKVENVASLKNIVRKRTTQKRSQSTNAEVLENKVAEADGGITQPKIGLRRSTRNVNMSEESEGLMDETDQKVSRKNLRQSTRQRASAKSSIEDVDKNTVAVEISQPEVVTRQSKRNRQSTDESTRCQTRHGTERMSVMPQMKKVKTEKPVAGNLGKKNIVVKDSPEESTKPIVVEKSSETGHIRRSKRNASGDGSLVNAEDANDCGTDSKMVTTKKRRRDAVLEEVPSQYTGRRVNSKADNISGKPKVETPVASEPRTRSGNRQASLLHSAKKFNMSGNMGPCGTAGEKASPRYTREPSTVPKRSATGARQSKTVAVTPQTRSGSGQKSFIHTTKKLRMSGNSGLHKIIGDKESPHQSREISVVSSCSGTESKGRGLKSKQTPVIHEHSRRFTRSALKGKTDGPAYVRGKIYQKKSQSVSKLPLSKVKVDRSTVNLVSNASDLPENETACSTPQGGSAKTNSVDLYVQESESPEMINIHEVSPSDPLNSQSNRVELEVDISTLQGGAPKTSTVDLNVQESEGPELMNIREASPSDPLNLQSNNAGIEMDILTPQGGSPKSRSVDLNVQESEGPELINIREASPGDPLNEQSNHAEFEVDISTPQGGSPKSSSVDLKVQESEGPELINIREASPGDPLNVQSNHAEFEVDISIPQGGSPKSSSVDLNVQESESPELMNIREASPSDTLDLQSNHAVHGDVNEDNSSGTQRENSCKTNVASPHLVHLKADAAAGDVFPADANALTNISLVDQSISTRTEEMPELSNDVESISKGMDLNLVFQGPAVHKDEPVYQSPFPEVAEIVDNSVSGKSDAACVAQQESPTEVDAKSPPLDHLMSADNIDITGDAGSIDTDHVDDYHLNVEHIISSTIKEKQQEVSENVNHVVAEGSTVNEVKSTAEVGDCGPTEQEHDICKHPAEFPESGRLDKDSKSASMEGGEAVSSADIFFHSVSMNFTVDKDDKMHPEISVQADELHNTSSKSGMQEKEFPVPNSIANTEEVSMLEYEFSKQEFSDTVTSTVMCSNKELEEDSNQRPSTVESCLMREESGTKICIELSTSNVVADSVSGENNKLQPGAPSSPLRATEFDNVVVEVNEELKPEDSTLNWRSDIFERAAVDGSCLQKERNSAKSTDLSEHNHSKNAEVKSENRKKVGAFDSSIREMSEMPEFTSSLPSHGTELGHLVAEVKEVKPKDSSSLWSTENVPKSTAEDGSSLHKQVGIEGRQVEETVFEDTVEKASERTSSMFGDAHHILEGQQSTERECDLGEMTCSISGDVEERRMNKNISGERTLVISKHDADRDNISCPVIAHEFPSSVGDPCYTPSEDSCGKEQDMSMVKSSKNFGKEFSSQHGYFYGLLKDSCGKEQGTPMSIVKSSKYCGEEFSGQHDKIIEQVKVCSTAALPQTICEDFTGFDNQIVADLMGSTGRRISRTGDLNIVKFEETEPSTVDGIESLKENSSTLVWNMVEDSGGYSEKSDAEIATHNLSEEDCYGKDAIDSCQIEDTVQQFDVNYGEIDSDFKVICQENVGRPYLLQMDGDTNNVENSRDNLIASDTINRFDQEANASGVPTEKLPKYEDAMDADAPANLQYGGESVTLTGETSKAQGVPTEELTRTEHAMDADAPANLQYGRESLTITGETNQAQERGPEDIIFCSDIFDPELKSRSDEEDGEESQLWFENSDAGKELDNFMVSPTEEQLQNSGEEHAREKGPESIEIQHAAFNNPSTGDDNVSVENSVGTLNESHIESEANKNAHQKIDCYNNNRSGEDFTRTES